MKRGGPLRAKSARRETEDQPCGARAQIREATFKRDGYRCVANRFVPGVPCTDALECDEAQGRGRQPGSHLDLACTQTLCGYCHRIKTTQPRVAGLLGLYGPTEQRRRLSEDDQGGLADALAQWARLKGVMAGSGPDWGGDPQAVDSFATSHGNIIHPSAWR